MESEDAPPTEEPLGRRLHRALGPLAVGILLDLLDLATFGPLGLYLGALIGLAAGWYLGAMSGFGPRGRTFLAVAAAIYLTAPMTEFLPLATLASALGRFRPRVRARPPE